MPGEIPMTTLLLAFTAAAIVFVLLWMIVSWWLSRRRKTVERRMAPAEDSDPTIVLDEVLQSRAGMSSWRNVYRRAQELLERTELRLEVLEAVALVLFCGMLLAAVVYFWRYEQDEQWLAVPAFFLGAGIPTAVILWRQGTWRRRMQDQLPDMIFLMARSLRAGMSLDQAIQVLGEHGVAPLSREFARMHRQLELGLTLPQVLQTTADRVKLVDFSVLASILSLHRQTGGGLPVLLDRLAYTTREHNQLRSHYRTSTALGRVSNGIMITLVMLVLFYLIFFQRDMAMHYFQTQAGLTLFAIGMGLEVLGLIILFFLLRKEEA